MCVPFHQYFDDFNHALRFEKRYSAHTITAYQNDLAQFQSFLQNTYPDIRLEQIGHFQLRSWLASLMELGLKERSINRKISSISGYYKYMMRAGKTKKNPTSLLHTLRLPERLPTFLKESETENLLENLSFGEGFSAFTDRLMIELLYTCGLRRSELLNLKESDIEWSLKQIRVLGKGNKERLMPLGAVMLDKLSAYITEKNSAHLYNEYLFVLANGKKIYEKYVYLRVKKYLTLITTIQKKSPHIMRHTFATHLLNNGASIQSIKELLGHSSIAATQIYTHINIDELKKIHKLNHPRG